EPPVRTDHEEIQTERDAGKDVGRDAGRRQESAPRDFQPAPPTGQRATGETGAVARPAARHCPHRDPHHATPPPGGLRKDFVWLKSPPPPNRAEPSAKSAWARSFRTRWPRPSSSRSNGAFCIPNIRRWSPGMRNSTPTTRRAKPKSAITCA